MVRRREVRVAQATRWCVMAVLLVGAATAQAQENYYKDKTLTFIVGYSPGGTYDQYTRLIARHIGKTDAELSERLRREPQISSASTYADRQTAERAVGAALEAAGQKLDAWTKRQGRRPNLVLDYADTDGRPLGRSMARGRRTAVPVKRALVVLRWDERRDRFFVLTSYPESDR